MNARQDAILILFTMSIPVVFKMPNLNFQLGNLIRKYNKVIPFFAYFHFILLITRCHSDVFK